MNRLVLATCNPKKVEEFRTLLDLDFDFPGVEYKAPEESEDSYIGNALIKARRAAEEFGQPALADDSGLEVRPLGGRPGVHSARYADGTDVDRMQKLLKELGPMTSGRYRSARYVCVLALAFPSGEPEVITQATCEGSIVHKIEGEGGFGYDGIFLPAASSENKVMAQLGSAEKNRISHRGKAVRAILPSLYAAVARWHR